MHKNLVLLEDLGISKEEIKTKAQVVEVGYNILDKREMINPEEVEVLINVKKKIGRKEIEQYPNLKMIGVAFTGYDSVDIETCTKKGIAVYNVPAYSTDSVAELAVGLTISLLRGIPKAHNAIHDNRWTFLPGIELKGKTIGILGTGKTGLAAARIFKAFGTELLGWSRTEKEAFKTLGGKYIADLTKVFAYSDVISIHLPNNKATKGIVAEKELKAMQKGAYIVNTARGPIIDEEALFEVLQDHKIAGAGLDVFTEEPLPKNHPLLSLDNVILTPHIAYKTKEALKHRVGVTLQNVKDFLDGEIGNKVN